MSNYGQQTGLTLYQCHHRAVELRYEGKSYDEIAVIISEEEKRDRVYKTQTIRKWFMRGGILEQEYIDYAKKENERRRRVVAEEMKKIIPKIPQKYVEILERSIESLDPETVVKRDNVTVKLLKDLCLLLGFKLNEDDSDAESVLAKYLRGIAGDTEKEIK